MKGKEGLEIPEANSIMDIREIEALGWHNIALLVFRNLSASTSLIIRNNLKNKKLPQLVLNHYKKVKYHQRRECEIYKDNLQGRRTDNQHDNQPGKKDYGSTSLSNDEKA